MKIAYGNSRMEKKWKNNEISWDDFCKRVSTTQTTTETVEEYRKMSKPQQDSIRDVGSFAAGHPAFLETDDEISLPDSYEKATKKYFIISSYPKQLLM